MNKLYEKGIVEKQSQRLKKLRQKINAHEKLSNALILTPIIFIIMMVK
jgi:hypothetical protein